MKNYLSLVKFSHTIFALPFACIGFFLAIHTTGTPVNWKLFILMLCCMITARSAAMAFNRYLDRKIDILNPRTAMREIPAGVISPTAALLFTLLNAALFISVTYFINPLCFYLSPIALLVVLGYSYTKRFTALCHLILGLGLSLAPIGAYLVISGAFAVLPLLFSAVVLLWVSGFDIIYALQDEDFDRQQHLHSIPAWLGKANALTFSKVLHTVAACIVVYVGFYGHFSISYWIGSSIFIGMLIYQHLLVKPTDLSKVNLAFMTSNGIASVVFAIFFLLDLWM